MIEQQQKVTNWQAEAACADLPPAELENFFGGPEFEGYGSAKGVRQRVMDRAKQVCAGCPVRDECLAYALDNRIEYGVWGGMDEDERRKTWRGK